MFSRKNMILKIAFRNAQEELGHAPHHYICFRGEFSSKMDSILSAMFFASGWGCRTLYTRSYPSMQTDRYHKIIENHKLIITI